MNEREENIRAQKVQMIYLLTSAETALQFQINKISQAHHSKNKNAVNVTELTSIKDVFIYFLFLSLKTEFQELRQQK